MANVKPIAFYLPQYHPIPENDEWWGEGFTEWTTLKKATPLYANHYQPRVPLDGNYYSLLDPKVQEWQAKIAKEHGIYGFCYYHYWFNRHLLLEKPLEAMLKNKKVDIPFCICWANEDWTNQWVSSEKKVLIAQKYGDEQEWIDHFNYFLPFFQDERYIKEDGCPFLILYRPELIHNLAKMLSCWRELAQKAGFPGLKVAFQNGLYEYSGDYHPELFDYQIEYQPQFYMLNGDRRHAFLKKIKRRIALFIERHFHKSRQSGSKIRFYDYEAAWKNIVSYKPKNPKHIAGAFVGWDNTPRKANRGSVFEGATPEKFEEYFKKQIKNVEENYQSQFLFVFAWNEWTEGGYLEPDEKYRYAYLEAIQRSLEESK